MLLLVLAFVLGGCLGTLPSPDGTAEVRVPTPTRLRIVTATSQSAADPLPSPIPTNTLVPTPNPDALRGVQVDFWHPFDSETSARVDQLVNDFNTSNPWGVVVRSRAFLGQAALVDGDRVARDVPERQRA